MKTHHTITIGNVTRSLPIREVAPGIRVALFNILGDWELTEAIGGELVKKIPTDTEILLMPDGKAQALLHVLGRLSGLPTIIARKEHKPYMAQPVLSVPVKSITTNNTQHLYLGNDDVTKITGRKVAIVDDVVSTGGTIETMEKICSLSGANIIAILAALTEGPPRQNILSLDHLPLF